VAADAAVDDVKPHDIRPLPDVREWLVSLGLAQYADAFEDNAIRWDVLSDLDHDVLKDIGVRPAGDRMRILKAAALLPAENESTRPTSLATTTDRPLAGGEAEHRQLTVMFCDLVGSTELSQTYDPEELRELNRTYQDAAKAAIERYGGYVARYMGDGVLAYFGYPQAHEDDPEQSVRAGLELITSLSRLDTLAELSARVGIATGPVVVGDLIGDGASQESAVVGETPNLAARLQGIAEPDSVVISESTHALLYDLFDCADLGERRLKGFAGQHRPWRVEGERSSESRFEALHSEALTPFVGRVSEVGLLLDRWETAAAGEGQVVLLEGEPGIGKSRLADEFRRAIGSRRHTPVRYQCSSHQTNAAFFPFVSQLQHAGKIRAQDDFDQRLDKLEMVVADTSERNKALWLFATLLSLPTHRYPPLMLESEQLKLATIEAFRNQLTALCRDAPVLILFEDVHWIDPTSREVLDTLMEAGQQLPVLFVLTHRPESDSAWGGHGFVTELRLNHLARRDGLSIIRDVARGKDLPEEITRQILAKTDGVALFVEELTKTVLESGLLREEPERYVLDGALPELAIPSTLRDSLMARLDRLLPVKQIAQAGACIGREFSHRLLQAVTGIPETELQQGLEQLIDNQLIFQRGTPPDATYSFKHGLVQDAAYESLLRARRRVIHAAILAELEANHRENLGEVVELLAHHAQRGELSDKAVTYLRQAGGKAYARSANRESRAYYEQALGILDALPDCTSTLEQAFEIHLELRPVLNQLGEPRRMLERLREAETLAERLNDDPRRGKVCALMTIANSQLGEHDEALASGTRALKIATDLEDLRLRILATTYLELVRYYRGEYESVVELATGNLEALPPEWVHEHLGASAPPSVYDRSWLIQSLAQIGRFADAITYDAEVLHIAEPTRHPFTIGQAHRATVTLYVLMGDWARARSLSEQWIAGVRAGNVVIQLPWAISSSAWILARVGETGDALDRLREGEQLVERQTERKLVATAGWDYHSLGRSSLLLGRLDDAQRLGNQAVEYSSHQFGNAAHGLHLLGDIATHPDRFDAERGEYHYRKALSIAESHGMRPLVAHCYLGIGKVYHRTGKHQEAGEFFNSASAMYRDMNMSFWVKQAEEEMVAKE
jgi:class 3 adenylate cyclase/tetratricopeptide (TPR) repeat protein